MKLCVFATIFCFLRESFAAKCMTPMDARFVAPMQPIPQEWKSSARWHTGDYFPSPEHARPRGILLTEKRQAARMWWIKDGRTNLYMFITKDQGSILCTLIGAGLQVGWSRVSEEAKRSGYCHWIINVNQNDPSLFQIRNYELSTIPDIGPVYLNRTGLYFDYGSNYVNDPSNRVDESLTWWRWTADDSDTTMRGMAEMPDQCELGESGLPLFVEEFDLIQGRSVGGRRGKRFKFSSEDDFARCNKQWFLHGLKCYRIFTAPGLKQSRTAHVCRILGGQIALPESDDENRFVRALGRRYAPGRRFWIRATISDGVASPTSSDFTDHGSRLRYSRVRSRRLMSSQKCAQISPRNGINWYPANCNDRSGRVLCERDATPTEQPGSLKCGKIQFENADTLMEDAYYGRKKTRIVGGSDAREGQLPWQAAIRFKEEQEVDGFLISHYCGGALIDHQWVVSAAHCFATREASDFVVRLGDLDNTFDEGHEQEFDIAQLISHAEYRSTPSHRNDISLIKLSRKAQLNNYVQPACLPTSGFRIRPDGENCQVSGWGLTDLDKGQASAATTLQFVTVPTMPNRLCSERYNKRAQYFVEDLMFCAGHRGGGKDSCSGDSGGPYVCRNSDGRYALAGIVSFGIGCAHKVYPGVYTNVRHYIPWITEQIRASGDNDLIT